MPSLRLGNTAPDFEAETTQGPIKFHDWIGNSWVRTRRALSRLIAHPGAIAGRPVLPPRRLHSCLHD